MIKIKAVNHSRAHDFRLESEAAGSGQSDYTWTQKPQESPFSDAVALDLLEIGRAVHLADLSVKRDLKLGRRTRAFRLQVEVSDPALWQPQRSTLAALAGFASCDAWTFEFVQSKPRPPAKILPGKGADGDVVALFSGGLDSLCGAAYLRKRGARPIFVSHSPPGRERNLDLITKLWAVSKGEPLSPERVVTFKLEPNHQDAVGKRTRFPESTRRTRPFFFLSLAAAVALERGIETIQMSENGAMALSLPLRNEAYGAFRARQAHDFLRAGFSELLRAVSPGKNWTVTNPFAAMTKGQACTLLANTGALAGESVSCEYVGRQRARLLAWKQEHSRRARTLGLGSGPQCGLCEPCISRRAALQAAGLPDPDQQYFFSLELYRILGPSPSSVDPSGLFPSLYEVVAPHAFWIERFCERIKQMNYYQFGISYAPELARSAMELGWPKKHALLKRYSDEILAFLTR